MDGWKCKVTMQSFYINLHALFFYIFLLQWMGLLVFTSKINNTCKKIVPLVKLHKTIFPQLIKKSISTTVKHNTVPKGNWLTLSWNKCLSNRTLLFAKSSYPFPLRERKRGNRGKRQRKNALHTYTGYMFLELYMNTAKIYIYSIQV